MSIREDVFDILDGEYIGDDDKDASDEHNYRVADQILSHPRIAILAEDQSRPKYSYKWARLYCLHSGDSYIKAQEDMSDFRRIEVKE